MHHLTLLLHLLLHLFHAAIQLITLLLGEHRIHLRLHQGRKRCNFTGHITEFGATPLYNRKELAEAGAAMVLYPLSAFRAMNKAALTVYQSILEKGDQKDVVDLMQTRMELYDFLNYHDFEQKLDQLFAQKKD